MAIEKVYENNQEKCPLCGGSGTWGAAARHTEADAVVPYRNTTSLHLSDSLSLYCLSVSPLALPALLKNCQFLSLRPNDKFKQYQIQYQIFIPSTNISRFDTAPRARLIGRAHWKVLSRRPRAGDLRPKKTFGQERRLPQSAMRTWLRALFAALMGGSSQVKLVLPTQIHNTPPTLSASKANELLLVLHLLIQGIHHK